MQNQDLSINPSILDIREDIKQALIDKKPVVALESTIITHGSFSTSNFRHGLPKQLQNCDRGRRDNKSRRSNTSNNSNNERSDKSRFRKRRNRIFSKK